MLAPMEGVIDHTMRDMLTSLGGIDRCVTEFVRVTEQLLPPRVFYRYCPELRTGGRTRSGVPVYLQLLGGQPGPLADNARRAAELGAPGIDLNFGCPAKTVNKSDGGAIILREPERVHRLVQAVRQAVPGTTPVTVKMRLGFEDSSRFLDNLQAINAAGATELVVHARTRKQGYRPPAWWDEITRARETVSMPVIANGEIWHPDDALRCAAETGCEALMLGRGALCRPDLPRLVHAAGRGVELQPLRWEQVLEQLQHYFSLTLANYDARYVGNPIKQWLVYLRHAYPQAGLLFDTLKRLQTPEDLAQALGTTVPAAKSDTLAA